MEEVFRSITKIYTKVSKIKGVLYCLHFVELDYYYDTVMCKIELELIWIYILASRVD